MFLALLRSRCRNGGASRAMNCSGVRRRATSPVDEWQFCLHTFMLLYTERQTSNCLRASSLWSPTWGYLRWSSEVPSLAPALPMQ